MTDNQKPQIKEYRDQGLSYSELSRMLGISVNSVKTYCKRHALGGTKAFDGKGSTEFCCEMKNPRGDRLRTGMNGKYVNKCNPFLFYYV